MLPGLRILFAITFLSVSVLIFGLGAAAFLRSAHDNFASGPWHPIEPPVTARADLVPATIAMLRVEPDTLSEPPSRAAAPVAASETRTSAEPASVAASAPVPPMSMEATEIENLQSPAAPEPPAVLEPVPDVAPLALNVPEAAQNAPVVAPEPLQEPAADAVVANGVEGADTKAPEPANTKAVKPTPVEAKKTDTANTAATNTETQTTAAPSTEISPPDAAPAAENESAPAPAAQVATSHSDQIETLRNAAAEPAAIAPSRQAPDRTEASAPLPSTTSGTDTLKADDRTIEAEALTTLATVSEPALPQIAPLPLEQVKLPVPRVDPSVIETRRKRLLAQRRARTRAAQARRVAAARAQAAAEAQAAAAANPFGFAPGGTAAARTY